MGIFKKTLSEDEIRANVDTVMSHWYNHRDFPQLLNALMVANDNMSSSDMSRRLKDRGYKYSTDTVSTYRKSGTKVPYAFVKAMVDTNLLSFNPGRIMDGGDHRERLFRKAGYIEITPANIQAHNAEILDNVAKSIEHDDKIAWANIILELMDFHTQGHVTTLAKIQDELRKMPFPGPRFVANSRLDNIVYGTARPNDAEVFTLYSYLNLTPDQQRLLEHEKISKDAFKGTVTPFSACFSEIESRLKKNGISIVDNSGGALNREEMYAWRHGKRYPNLQNMRKLVHTLNDLVAADAMHEREVTDLIKHSGFSPSDIYKDAHRLIADADENKTLINDMLYNIRNAVGLMKKPADIAAMASITSPDITLTSDQIWNWEHHKGHFATEPQLRELMARYSRHLPSPITPEEVDKLVRINERSHQEHRDSLPGRQAWANRIVSDALPGGNNLRNH